MHLIAVAATAINSLSVKNLLLNSFGISVKFDSNSRTGWAMFGVSDMCDSLMRISAQPRGLLSCHSYMTMIRVSSEGRWNLRSPLQK